MTIEERFQQLLDRHEALTQTVELLAERQKETDRRLAQVLEAITRLTNIAEAHERGLDNLENQ
jgi:chromosome segregation ATPase